MTQQEFVAWCDEDPRAEWVDGQLVIFWPGHLEHCRLHAWLLQALWTSGDQRALGEVLPDATVRLAEQRSRHIPDIWFLA